MRACAGAYGRVGILWPEGNYSVCMREAVVNGRRTTYQADETVSMKRMATREDVELSGQEEMRADRACFSSVDRHKTVLQSRDILFDRLSRLRSLVHILLQCIDMRRVTLQSMCNLLLEIINDDKVRKEWKDILDLEKISVLQKPHSPVDLLRE